MESDKQKYILFAKWLYNIDKLKLSTKMSPSDDIDILVTNYEKKMKINQKPDICHVNSDI